MLYTVVAALAYTSPKNYAALFESWKEAHGKAYTSSTAEAKAFSAFAHNEDAITQRNALKRKHLKRVSRTADH